MQFDVNLVAVFAAALSNMVIGFLWYGPVLGKKWMAESGVNPELMKSSVAKSAALGFAGALVMAYVFAHILVAFGAMNAMMALMGAFWVWLGFPAVLSVGSVAWENKSWTLFLINAGYWLVALIAMALVLVLWPF